MAASILFDGIAFYYIYNFKGLQAHPMKLFMWMSFFTFSYFWLLFGAIKFCDLRLDKFFCFCGIDVFKYLNSHGWTTLDILVKAIPFQLSFCYGMIISLNTCLCFDLILTQRDPFTRPESRYVKYFTISVFLSLFSACIQCTYFKYSKELNILMVITYSAVAIYSSIVTIISLKSKDMSSTARQMIIRRHIAYIAVNFLCQIYGLSSKKFYGIINIPGFFIVFSALFFF